MAIITISHEIGAGGPEIGQQGGRARESDPLTYTGDERDLALQTEIHESTLVRHR